MTIHLLDPDGFPICEVLEPGEKLLPGEGFIKPGDRFWHSEIKFERAIDNKKLVDELCRECVEIHL